VARLSVMEAATRLGVSPDTIRRRIRNGELKAWQEPTPQGYSWKVELPDEEPRTDYDSQHTGQSSSDESLVWRELVDTLRDEVSTLREQLMAHQDELGAKNKQIEQLHILLQQAQAALPAPRENHRSWWRFWQR
jgi:hypothetical protein